MLAASYWSLLAPAIDMAEESGSFGAFAFFPVALGFALGAAFVYFADLLLPVLVSEPLGWEVLVCRFCHGRIQTPIGFSRGFNEMVFSPRPQLPLPLLSAALGCLQSFVSFLFFFSTLLLLSFSLATLCKRFRCDLLSQPSGLICGAASLVNASNWSKASESIIDRNTEIGSCWIFTAEVTRVA